MSPRSRLFGGAAILAVVVWQLGPGPVTAAVEAAFDTADPVVLAASAVVALAISVVTTLMCAWRWCALARGFGVELPLAVAVAAYYRSQFLNATLPSGILGDVHRAHRHGALPVVADRGTGQVVQVIAAGAVVSIGPAPWLAGVLAAAVVAAAVRWPRVVATSLVATAGHVTLFVVAARVAGVTAPLAELLPVALVVMVAAAIPMNVAGWGPREGAAAVAFGAAGLGAAQGTAVAVLFGVLALVSTLPGAVLIATRMRPRSRAGREVVGG